jgi:Protein of unknown function (DUF2939)
MRARWPILAVFLAIGTSYAAYPYITLLRLGEAIRQGDAATLKTLVDWPAVREGIKEDICDQVLDAPQVVETQHPAALPPFGASFVRGIAGNSIDRTITPEALVAAVGTPAHKPAAASGADVHVSWAFFDDPTVFSVSLSAPGQAEPIKLQMRLRDGRWRVRRVWLPADLLQANARA